MAWSISIIQQEQEDIQPYSLSLSIVKHIVAYYDGEIDLQTKPGEGSTFIIKMPITEESGRKLEI